MHFPVLTTLKILRGHFFSEALDFKPNLVNLEKLDDLIFRAKNKGLDFVVEELELIRKERFLGLEDEYQRIAQHELEFKRLKDLNIQGHKTLSFLEDGNELFYLAQLGKYTVKTLYKLQHMKSDNLEYLIFALKKSKIFMNSSTGKNFFQLE